MDPSLQQSLNGQEVQRISGYKVKTFTLELDLEPEMLVVFVEEWTEVTEELRKRKVDICGLQEIQWRGEKTRLLELKEEDTSYGGWKMMLKWVVWKYWSSRSCVMV